MTSSAVELIVFLLKVQGCMVLYFESSWTATLNIRTNLDAESAGENERTRKRTKDRWTSGDRTTCPNHHRGLTILVEIEQMLCTWQADAGEDRESSKADDTDKKRARVTRQGL